MEYLKRHASRIIALTAVATLIGILLFAASKTYGVPNSIKNHRGIIKRYHQRLKHWGLYDKVHISSLEKGYKRGQRLHKKWGSNSSRFHPLPLAWGKTYTLSGGARLRGVHPDLVSLINNVAIITPILVPQYGGVRTLEEQRKLTKRGNSQLLQSKHLKGRAVDFVPYPGKSVDWSDSKGFVYTAGILLGAWYSVHATSLRWGGDWGKQGHPGCSKGRKKCFVDLGHVELPH